MERTIHKSDVLHDLKEILGEVEIRAASAAGTLSDKLAQHAPDLVDRIPDPVADHLPSGVTDRLPTSTSTRRKRRFLGAALCAAAIGGALVAVRRMRGSTTHPLHATNTTGTRSEPSANPVPEPADPLTEEAPWTTRN